MSILKMEKSISPPGFRVYAEEAERFQQPGELNDSKETVSSRNNRDYVHRNSETLAAHLGPTQAKDRRGPNTKRRT